VTQETNIYLHIPFCRRRCGYCDFNTFAGFSHTIPVYVKALCREVEFLAEREENKRTIKTIFFGGGTPSLLSVSQFSEIMGSLRKSFELDPQAEITLEANPGTVSREYLSALRAMGFTRISFGMQSAHPHDLIMLDRQHTFEDVANAVAWSRSAGFDHVNLDLIFGIPGQSLESWQRTLKLAAGFDVDHLSLYSLTIEEGTPMAGWLAKGLIQAVEDDLSADMYQSAGEILPSGGFMQYEISNWAKMRPDGIQSQCRHNLNTWRYQPYYGFGAGAHGFIGDIRTANVEPIPVYLDRMNSPQGDWPAAESVERLTQWDEMQEFMMVGLRLTLEGISQSEFYERFDIPCQKVFGRQVEMCMEHGLLEFSGAGNDIIRLTPHGRLLGNQVFMEFVGNELPDGCQVDQ
jgi:oxygen-independent coproporphyrinogen-3 oxidase